MMRPPKLNQLQQSAKEGSNQKQGSNDHGKHKGKENRYSVLDLLSASDVGRSITVTMINGRTESGKLEDVAQFEIGIRLTTGKTLIILKHAIVTVSFT